MFTQCQLLQGSGCLKNNLRQRTENPRKLFKNEKSSKDKCAPRFVTRIEGAAVEESARVFFEGIVDAKPNPKFNWYFEDEPIIPGRFTRRSYVCLVKNTHLRQNLHKTPPLYPPHPLTTLLIPFLFLAKIMRFRP